jgi:hypothetical protein
VDNQKVKMEPIIITKEPRMLQDMVATTTHVEGTIKADKTLEVRKEDITILVVEVVATMIHVAEAPKVDKTLEVRKEDITILVVEVVAIMIATKEAEEVVAPMTATKEAEEVATMIATKEDIIMSHEEDIMIPVAVVAVIMIVTKAEIEANSNKGVAGSEKVSHVIEIRADMIGINHPLEELLCLMKEAESQRVVTQYIYLEWVAM